MQTNENLIKFETLIEASLKKTERQFLDLTGQQVANLKIQTADENCIQNSLNNDSSGPRRIFKEVQVGWLQVFPASNLADLIKNIRNVSFWSHFKRTNHSEADLKVKTNQFQEAKN